MLDQDRSTALAAFLLRIALGAMFIAHSLILKLFVFTLPGTAKFFGSIGLPEWSAYVVFVLEAIGGVLLILGVQVRLVAAVLIPILAGATWAHWGNGWMFGYPNGGWEYPLYLTLLAGVQVLLGEAPMPFGRPGPHSRERVMSQPLILVSFDLCPYVQRAAIVLREKNVPYERIDIDLSNKPDWFRAISPLGKVPLLKVGDEVLFESAVIAEYLEETHGPALHPADPLEKARHRAWIEFGSTILADIWVVETTKDAAAFDAKIALLKEKFARVEAVLGEGPFFAGSGFSLVDAAFAPAFRYFDVFDPIADLGVFAEFPKVQAWRKALAKRPSVATAVVPDYPERLMRFLEKHDGVILKHPSYA